MLREYILKEMEKKLRGDNSFLSEQKLSKLKRAATKKMGGNCPTNIELLATYKKMVSVGKLTASTRLEKSLVTKAVRTESGVAVVSVLTKPYACPGHCAFCPTEKNMPKSYLSNEPAVMRAIATRFHPYRQMRARLESLELTGHHTDKIELIVMGGTFSYLPRRYQNWFIKECFRAANEFGKRTGTYQKELLEKQQTRNETARKKIVGLTLETRPDFVNEKEIVQMRKLGCTRVELGVQSVDDAVLELNRRGHLTAATVRATWLLKSAGFKINYHMMPELPGSSPEKDLKMFEELWQNPAFRPDMLKIYPCVVVRDAEIYDWFKSEKYKPYVPPVRLKLLAEIKKHVPRYVRITRLIRDIPSNSIVGGNRVTNLRQTLAQLAEREGWRCRCIRCREVRQNAIANFQDLKMFREDYTASEGTEIFLSFEDQKRRHLYALLRLRINQNSEKHFLTELNNAAIIREVHTYGKLVPLAEREKKSPQHFGLGGQLLAEAERIARDEFNAKKIAVISGVGVRGYYRKHGYKKRGTYMLKLTSAK